MTSTGWMIHLETGHVIGAAILFVVGVILSSAGARLVERWSREHSDARRARVIRRIFHYSFMALVILAALDVLGVGVGVLLGAAGILSLGIGFASQTSLSNIISGLFLIGERFFSLGDAIQVGTLTGEVLAIDLLSVKLRTYDNLYVRVPNETLIKSEITNLTRLPIRRLDLTIGVGYDSDLAEVRSALLGVARRLTFCLEEPAPLAVFTGFGASSINVQFSIWIRRENYSVAMNGLADAILKTFREMNIDLPYPQQTIHFSAADPLVLKPPSASPDKPASDG
ncbi:MscS Mechanosensitive ion channel [mine drainage metagenome]|uniref:MscS Mechanosensitive ion channel n=1 Tax=mine drainage metagenome TaxID=410659 RepID=T0YM38_9ZZZZ